ncbi:MAG: thiamine pyrophosphate-binding protein [Ardenticatenaceae bacterium]|nr:thiamine pyrophosphate-binding protein [Ardenticatenaceae bacterium]
MSLAEAILTELKAVGVRWLTWLPDSETKAMYSLIADDPDLRLVQVCREDEAVGVCYGLLKGGARAAVMIQNTGMMNAVDAIRGIPLRMQQPMLLLVGYRGYEGMVRQAANVDTAAIYTEPLLQALKIPYYLVHSAEDAGKIGAASREAEQTSGPAVVLITREYE